MTALSIAAANQTSTAAAATATTAAGTAQTTLGSNYQTFLKLLMTQLQNQDPTSPLDTNQFTQQLVQYSSVEQQIQTNSNLGQLIQLGQSNAVLQSASLIGHQVALDSKQLSLQNGHAGVQYTAQTAGPVSISISDAAGRVISTAQATAAKGDNTWSWNGALNGGSTAPDGKYTVAVRGASGALPFTVLATATSVTQDTSGASLKAGDLSVPFSAVKSVK